MIDRALLWRAWPLGCLPIRGVVTVGGWTCITGIYESACGPCTSWAPPDGWVDRSGGSCKSYALWIGKQGDLSDNREGLCQAVERGDFLPLVDPTDTATWACLLKDLASGCTGCEAERLQAATSLAFYWNITWNLTDGSAMAFWGKNDVPALEHVKSAQIAEALVLIRIRQRETA